jgi:3alpha(or 20beta)-hydroxysteroid dehydrogenase
MSASSIPRYSDALRLDGQGFIVLGAGQGIGEQAAHAISQSGGKILCVDMDASRANSVATAVGGVALVCDVLSRNDMQAAFADASRLLGVEVRGVVDVVGMPIGRTLAQLDDDAWQRQFDLVIRHAYLAVQLSASVMVNGGSITLVGSMAGSIARSGALLAYGAAKAALHHFARGAAQELAAQGIRVNVVAPGLTKTPRLLEANEEAFWSDQETQIPLGRAASPVDIANAILFMASPMASHITGSVIGVDGGASLGPSRLVASSGPSTL